MGTDLSDVFNAPIEDVDWGQRVHQDFITENLGFAQWIKHGTSQFSDRTPHSQQEKVDKMLMF